jgi:hypothetical protein
MNTDLRSRIESEEKGAETALKSIFEVHKELEKIDPGLAKKMKGSMDALNIGVNATLQPDKEDKVFQIRSLVDHLHRFMNFAESGKTLIDLYYDMVDEIFHMKSGQEKGFVILGHKERQSNIGVEAFHKNVKKAGPRITKKMCEVFKGCAILPRLSLHMTSPGEIVPLGYVPEDKNVVIIDGKGMAKKIVSVNAKVDPSEGTDPNIKPKKA